MPLESHNEGLDLRLKRKIDLCHWECPVGNAAQNGGECSIGRCNFFDDGEILLNLETNIIDVDENQIDEDEDLQEASEDEGPHGDSDDADQEASDDESEHDYHVDADADGTDIDDEHTRTVQIDMSDDETASLQGSEEDINLPQLKVAELREMCKQYELDSRGKKAELVARLEVFIAEMNQ
jgi:hypothetical protein